MLLVGVVAQHRNIGLHKLYTYIVHNKKVVTRIENNCSLVVFPVNVHKGVSFLFCTFLEFQKMIE
jgi:hypothetical protein